MSDWVGGRVSERASGSVSVTEMALAHFEGFASDLYAVVVHMDFVSLGWFPRLCQLFV